MTGTTTITLPKRYQLSTIGVGAIVTGLESLKQRIDLILRTIKGSDPLRPLFGSDVYLYIDKPLNIAIPKTKKAMFEAISIWEPEVRITAITHKIVDFAVYYKIVFTTNDGLIEDSLTWSAGGVVSGGVSAPAGIILSATIPAKVLNGVYNVSFVVDGTEAFPKTPLTGFADAAELLQWVNENWFNFGKWYTSGEKLMLYMNSGVAKTAALVVSQTAFLTQKSLIPTLEAGQGFEISLFLNGVTAQPAPPSDISTVEQLFLWVLTNWGNYGSWTIESTPATFTEEDFGEDFSLDFDSTTGASGLNYLVFQSNKFNTISLSIS